MRSPRSSLCSPPAVAPWAGGRSIAPMISTAVSTFAWTVGSRTWSDTWGSGSEAIGSSVTPNGDGSTAAAGTGSPSAVGSGSSAMRGGNWLGSGSRVGLVSTSAMSTVSFDLQDTSTLSMNVARLSLEPSPYNCGGGQSSLIKQAEAAVRVAHVIRQENKIIGVVLERVVPLLQQTN